MIFLHLLLLNTATATDDGLKLLASAADVVEKMTVASQRVNSIKFSPIKRVRDLSNLASASSSRGRKRKALFQSVSMEDEVDDGQTISTITNSMENERGRELGPITAHLPLGPRPLLKYLTSIRQARSGSENHQVSGNSGLLSSHIQSLLASDSADTRTNGDSKEMNALDGKRGGSGRSDPSHFRSYSSTQVPDSRDHSKSQALKSLYSKRVGNGEGNIVVDRPQVSTHARSQSASQVPDTTSNAARRVGIEQGKRRANRPQVSTHARSQSASQVPDTTSNAARRVGNGEGNNLKVVDRPQVSTHMRSQSASQVPDTLANHQARYSLYSEQVRRLGNEHRPFYLPQNSNNLISHSRFSTEGWSGIPYQLHEGHHDSRLLSSHLRSPSTSEIPQIQYDRSYSYPQMAASRREEIIARIQNEIQENYIAEERKRYESMYPPVQSIPRFHLDRFNVNDIKYLMYGAKNGYIDQIIEFAEKNKSKKTMERFAAELIHKEDIGSLNRLLERSLVSHKFVAGELKLYDESKRSRITKLLRLKDKTL